MRAAVPVPEDADVQAEPDLLVVTGPPLYVLSPSSLADTQSPSGLVQLQHLFTGHLIDQVSHSTSGATHPYHLLFLFLINEVYIQMPWNLPPVVVDPDLPQPPTWTRLNVASKEIVQLQKCTGSEPEVLRIINYLRDMDPTKMVAYYTFEQLAKFLFVSNFDYQLHMKKCLIRHQQEYYRLFQIPLSNMPGLEGGGCSTYFWAHATTDNGLIGILKLKRVLRTFPDSVGHKTYGFFCGATNNPWSDWEKLRVVIARWTAGKNIANFIISGLAHSNKTQGKCPAGGTEIEQKLCKLHDVCHNAKEKRWCVKPKVTQITDIWIVERIEPDTSPE